MSNETMLAARIHNYGGPEVIVVEQTPKPVPQAGEVLVRLKAAGVNPADWKFRSGFMKQFMPLTFPWTMGLEGAGIVEAVGQGVTAFKPGQAVFGTISHSYAQYALAAPAELLDKPEPLSFEEAAGVPVGALTAWQATLIEANVQPRQHVLVHGGAGGVGLFAVQFARWKGAHVTATASAANADFVRSLGAEEVIDYHTTKFEDAVHAVDAVIDTVGGDLLERSLQVTRQGGMMVTVAGRPDPEMGQARNIRVTSARRADPSALAEITELIVAQQVKPFVGVVFPLSQARQAQELSQTGHGRGRIILLTA
jgi:NADPH:quinone reductase-like Zn-dependent oxidoreductase